MPPRARVDPLPALKGQLGRAIVTATSGFSQWEAASFLETDQARISELKRGRVEKFTLDRLVTHLCRLDYDVTIEVRHKTGRGVFAPRP